MAGNILLPIKTIFDDKGLKAAQKSFSALSGTLKGIVAGAVISQITDMAKAAGQDAKSQALLAQQMRNVTGASAEQIASVEDAINKMSNQTGIVDDQLRPAMSNLVRATGDVTKAQDLLALSTDVAAATGKDLGAVSQALGKAVNGQTTALFKMIPSLKDSSNWMEELRLTTQGMAESAANADPFSRLQVTMDNIQEQIGLAFLPMFEDMANYFASDSFQGAVQSVADGFDRIGSAMDLVGQKVPWLQSVFDKIGESFSNGKWVELIPIVGAYIGMLSDANTKPTVTGIDETSRLITRQVDKYRRAAMPVIPDAKGGGKSAADAAKAAAKAAADAAKKRAQALADAIATQKRIREEAAAQAKELADAYRESAKAMNESFISILNGTTPLKRVTVQIGEFEQQVVDSFQNIEDQITSSLADGTLLSGAAKMLRDYAAKEKAALLVIARQRDVLSKKLDIAKSISAGILSNGNITNLLDKQTKTITETFTRMVNGIQIVTTKSFEEITSGGLVDNFKKVIEKTKAYANNLIALKKLGLNGQLFKQIVDAGVDAGGDTAQAIVDGGQSTVSELNNLFGQLNDLGGQIASESTDVMYQAGEDVMNSFIQALLDQDTALQNAATVLATNFANTFKALTSNLVPTELSKPVSKIDMGEKKYQSFIDETFKQAVDAGIAINTSGMFGNANSMRINGGYGPGPSVQVNVNANVVKNDSELGLVVYEAIQAAQRAGAVGSLII